jgi:hypothetical protein
MVLPKIPQMARPDGDRKLLARLIPDAAALLAIGTGTFYLVGWSYNFGYLHAFGIDTSLFPDSFADTVTFGFRVLTFSGVRFVGRVMFVTMVVCVATPPVDRLVHRPRPRWLRKLLGHVDEFDARLSARAQRVFDLAVAVVVTTGAMLVIFGVCQWSIAEGDHAASELRSGRVASLLAGEHPPATVLYGDGKQYEYGLLIRASETYVAVSTLRGAVVVPRDHIYNIQIRR